MVRQKVFPQRFFWHFFSNRLEFKSEILQKKYLVILCAHNGIIIIQLGYSTVYFKVICIRVTPPSDFSVLKNFRTNNVGISQK